MSFGQRLRELRKKQNLSQDYLAKKLGITKGAISQWELGLINSRNIKAENMDKLVRILNTSVSYLLSGKRDKAYKVTETPAEYESNHYSGFILKCMLYVLKNGDDLSHEDKMIATRLLYNKCKKNERISRAAFKDIQTML